MTSFFVSIVNVTGYHIQAFTIFIVDISYHPQGIYNYESKMPSSKVTRKYTSDSASQTARFREIKVLPDVLYERIVDYAIPSKDVKVRGYRED